MCCQNAGNGRYVKDDSFAIVSHLAYIAQTKSMNYTLNLNNTVDGAKTLWSIYNVLICPYQPVQDFSHQQF